MQCSLLYEIADVWSSQTPIRMLLVFRACCLHWERKCKMPLVRQLQYDKKWDQVINQCLVDRECTVELLQSFRTDLYYDQRSIKKIFLQRIVYKESHLISLPILQWVLGVICPEAHMSSISETEKEKMWRSGIEWDAIHMKDGWHLCLLLKDVVVHDQMDKFEFLLNYFAPQLQLELDYKGILAALIKGGKIKWFRYFTTYFNVSDRCLLYGDGNALLTAAGEGNLELMKLILNIRSNKDDFLPHHVYFYSLQIAAQRGHCSVVIWLCRNIPAEYAVIAVVFEMCGRHNLPFLLRWTFDFYKITRLQLRQKLPYCNYYFFRYNLAETLLWGCIWGDNITMMEQFIQVFKLERWDVGISDSSSIRLAVSHGHGESMKWFLDYFKINKKLSK